MSNNERIYRIDQLLNDRKVISFRELLDKLEVSPATLKRDLAYMRDRLNAPIVYDKELNGYRFEADVNEYALPGLWFSPEEIFALLTMQHLLSNLDSDGFLSKHIMPLKSRLLAILDESSNSLEEIQKRVKVEKVGSRHFNLEHFQEIGSALVNRKRLTIAYHSRSKDESTNREISPQRIIYYRDNWYLDAWCHMKDALRSFSIDAVRSVTLLDKVAADVKEEDLDLELGSGYGIFGGKKVEWAVLRFTPEKARWVSQEKWHPQQSAQFLADGSYELKVPFSDERELIMDIIKYGTGVTVISPPELVAAICSSARDLLNQYKSDKK